MTRVIIALCHIDKKIDQKELRWIKKIISMHSFSDYQKSTLINDIEHPQKDFLSIFKTIDDYSTRLRTLDLARYAFSIDNNLCQNEKKIFEELNSIHKSLSPNVVKNMKHVAKTIVEEEKNKDLYKDLEIFGRALSQKGTRPSHIFFSTAWIIHTLLFGNWMTRLILIGLMLFIVAMIIYRSMI